MTDPIAALDSFFDETRTSVEHAPNCYPEDYGCSCGGNELREAARTELARMREALEKADALAIEARRVVGHVLHMSDSDQRRALGVHQYDMLVAIAAYRAARNPKE